MNITPELHRQIYDEAEKLVCKVTCQIFIKDRFENYDCLGSGVLCELNDDYYILTAAHVTVNITETFGLLTTAGFYEVNFQRILQSKDENEPKIDLAYIKINQLENSTFLKAENIKISHELTDSINYIIYGFAANKTKQIKVGKTVSEGNLLLTHSISKKQIKKQKINESLFYGLDFWQKGANLKTGKKSKNLGSQQGMSGGGLWHILLKKNGSIEFYLIGIMTEQEIRLQTLIGNRIDSLIQVISEREKSQEAEKLMINIDRKFNIIFTKKLV